MRHGTNAAAWAGVVLASLVMHAVAFGRLGRGDLGVGPAPRKRRPVTVEMTVAPAKAPLPLAEAPRAVIPKPHLRIARLATKLAAKVAAVAPTPVPELPAAAEALADFTGETLTNDGPGAGWSSVAGNGQKMNGPVGRPGALVSHRNVEGTPGGTGSGPPIVGLGDLSRVPVAPDLSEKLAAAYPRGARARGLEGKAVVKARITPDGQVRDLRIVSETAPGFGVACEETLRGSAWSPPLDRDGRAVATVINYTCRFDVE